MIRVLLVDDHPIVHVGVRAGLWLSHDIQVVGEACDADGALSTAVRVSPQVALVVLSVPGIDGIETAKRLRGAVPGLRIILLSRRYSSFDLERALQMHPSGLLLKSEPPERLAEFIRRAMTGEQVFSSAVFDMLEPGPEGYRLSSRRGSKLALLSCRERAMLQVLAEGLSLKQAARRLNLSYKAADHVKAAVMRKFGVHDRVDLARIAIREGLADVWDDRYPASPRPEPHARFLEHATSAAAQGNGVISRE